MSIADVVMGFSILVAFVVIFYAPRLERRWRSRDGKTHVSLEKVEAAREYLRAVNKIPLENIAWTRQGRVVEAQKEWVDEWKFVGLSNTDFAELRMENPDD